MHTLLQGDCIEVMRTMQENSVDSLVTDPPAGISFMGKEWDDNKGGRDKWIVWLTEVMQEAYRVMKPGAHGLVWALPRTSHWTATALENAGFEIRDRVSHIYGNGFPKSLNVGKAIDKAAGVKRTDQEWYDKYHDGKTRKKQEKGVTHVGFSEKRAAHNGNIRELPATDEAKQWEGWGTALKPAMEDWWLIRKPLSEKTVAANVLKWGTGALNIEGCRVETLDMVQISASEGVPFGSNYEIGNGRKYRSEPQGRFPSHVIHDGSDEVIKNFPQTTSGKLQEHHKTGNSGLGIIQPRKQYKGEWGGDSGSASRFFYCAKASSADREEGLEDSELYEAEGFGDKDNGYNVRTWIDRKDGKGKVPVNAKRNPRANHHPTVKSTELMRYLCRLITPPNGIVLDCFLGSGSTGKGAIIEGFQFIGIEKDKEYIAIAEKRITAKYLPLFQEPPRQPTQREPDKRDSAASQASFPPEFLSDLEGLS